MTVRDTGHQRTQPDRPGDGCDVGEGQVGLEHRLGRTAEVLHLEPVVHDGEELGTPGLRRLGGADQLRGQPVLPAGEGQVRVVAAEFHGAHRTQGGNLTVSTMPVMRPASFTRPALAASALILALGLVACGEDDPDDEAGDDSSTPSETADSPTASRTETEAEAAGSCSYVPDGTGGDVELPPADPVTSRRGRRSRCRRRSASSAPTLDGDRTPCTTNSFVSLVEQAFYDGTTLPPVTTSKTSSRCCSAATPTATAPAVRATRSRRSTTTAPDLPPPGRWPWPVPRIPTAEVPQFFIVVRRTATRPGVHDLRHRQAGHDRRDHRGRGRTASRRCLGPEDGTPNTEITVESATVD